MTLDGNAVVYGEQAFGTTCGKTAHGLVRRTSRYRVTCVIDSRHAGGDCGLVLDGRANGIPLVATVDEAVEAAARAGTPATHFVIGLAPDGGRLPPAARADVLRAIRLGLNVDSGLHDFLSEDAEIAEAARDRRVTIRDIRRPPDRRELHFFSGRIEQVASLKVAVLGTDSAIGKRTTALLLVEGLRGLGLTAEMIGTGQTAWLQGVRYGIVLDSLINDFVAGEIEHAVWSAWNDLRPDVIVLEGQGSLLNPAYPGGFELLAAGRPDIIVLQHAPARKEYDGFPGYAMHPLTTQIRALEMIADRPVVAITLNHEALNDEQLAAARADVQRTTGRPVFDVLREGPEGLAKVISAFR
ncbi:MAG: DUF1611 domain-containing protein [Phycisphaerales bacterium]|nr:MAG: DUF1611 domain-containing protein [Phycisphaerales bacterium]